jgi:hypothetical protein
MRIRFGSIAFGLVLVSIVLIAPLARPHSSGLPAAAAPAAGSVIFERNDGQHPSDVRFMARGSGYRLAARDGAPTLTLRRGSDADTLAIGFDGARTAVQPRGEQPATAHVNYFVGRDPRGWRANVPTFERVRYANLYDGVDVIFYGRDNQLEYDVVVAPGADPTRARLTFGGSESARIAADGSLVLALPNGDLQYTKPIAYQRGASGREPIDVAYRLDGEAVTFAVGDYDRGRELVIDPVLVFSTYFGGSEKDEVLGVAVDAAGNTYVTGQTLSSDFPRPPASPPPTLHLFDAFISKFDRGGGLVYTTFFGGAMSDVGAAVAVDAAGAAYVAGATESSDLPTTSGAFQTQYGGAGDAFVVKLAPAGNRLVYATYLGGRALDPVSSYPAIVVDPTGIATVVGSTLSDNFPTTSGALQRTHPANMETAFATRLNAAGTGLVFSTLLTGTDQTARGVALDAQNRAIVVGWLGSGEMQTTRTLGPRGNRDGFALKLNTTASALVFSTRFGGTADDSPAAVTYDPNRDVAFVAGSTRSADFPASGLQSFGGEADAFLLTIAADGSSGPYSALLGGSRFDEATAIGSSGDYITLMGQSVSDNFPVVHSLQSYGGLGDGFVARLRGSADVIFNTWIGGSGGEQVHSGVVDGAGAATFGGTTFSPNFPTAHAFDSTYNGDSVRPDGFVSRLALVPRGTPGPHDVVVHVADAATLHGDWEKVTDASAAGGARLHNPDRGRAKVETPLAAPADYFEFTVRGLDAGPYRLWIRGKADGDAFTNDSVWVQFERAQNAGSDADNERDIFRIGTAEAMAVVIEDCSNCGLRGWGWQDGAYGQKLLGTPLWFNNNAPVTIRVQRREDGISIDQIVIAKDDLGEGPNFAAAPGYQKDDDTILPAQDPVAGGDIVLRAVDAESLHGTWIQQADATAAENVKARNPDAGAPKVATPLASPVNYVEFSFRAIGGIPYRLWIRGRADNDFYGNDSAYVQFSGSVDSAGNPIWRIGTASATTYVLEDCNGCDVQGWGWNDNGYGTGVLGPLVRFPATGTYQIRIQTREDGLSIDQIVLSPERYLTTAPGKTKNDDTIVPR